jgi:hypothetical protein
MVPVSDGYERAFLQKQQLGTLKRITLFLLQQHVIANPDMYVNFEKLRDTDGSMGREILLTTLFQEKREVLEMAFEIINRVQYADSLRQQAKKQAEMLKSMDKKTTGTGDAAAPSAADKPASKGATGQGAIATPSNAAEYVASLEKLRETVDRTVAVGKKAAFVEIAMSGNDGQPVHVHGKLSTVENDPTVYVTYPQRRVNGKVDHAVNDIQPLCGSKITEFFQTTSKEEGAVQHENESDRLELGRFRREMCLYNPDDIKVQEKRLDGDFYNKPMPDNTQIAMRESQEARKKEVDTRAKFEDDLIAFYTRTGKEVPDYLLAAQKKRLGGAASVVAVATAALEAPAPAVDSKAVNESEDAHE